jgi:hypothetical protein
VFIVPESSFVALMGTMESVAGVACELDIIVSITAIVEVIVINCGAKEAKGKSMRMDAGSDSFESS